VLAREGALAESSAVTLLARRGAGSVRDGMSLLGQVMALGSDSLTLADVREVLGLVGSEVFVRLMKCMQARDLLGLHSLLTEILDQGADLGFFLRELAGCWRNLFLLHQMGEAAQSIIDLPKEEVDMWSAVAPGFSPGHLHAAWQMTMDGQRKVLTSMEPTLALELLLLNMAFLPDLLAMGTGDVCVDGSVPPSARPGPARPMGSPALPHAAGGAPARPVFAQEISAGGGLREQHGPQAPIQPSAQSQAVQHHEQPRTAPGSSVEGAADQACEPGILLRESRADFKNQTHAPASTPPIFVARAASTGQAGPVGPGDWSGFVAFCAKRGEGAKLLPALDKAQGELLGAELVLTSQHIFLCDRLKASMPVLMNAARAYFGPGVTVRIEAPVEATHRTRTELRDMALIDPVVRDAQERFQAWIVDVRPKTNETSKENEI
jgi:DNA polymerase-3 subunit gamma/tau